MDEKEKENYFNSSDISYIKGNSDINEKERNIDVNNNFNFEKKNTSTNLISNFVNNNKCPNGYLIKNKSSDNKDDDFVDNVNLSKFFNNMNNEEKNNNTFNPNDPFILHNLFHKTIKHILSVKPFFIKLQNNIPLKEMEFDYFKKELNKNGNNMNILLDGCLDCIKDI